MLNRMRHCYNNVASDERRSAVAIDYELLKSRLFDSPGGPNATNFRDAVMITPRNSTRVAAGLVRLLDFARRHNKIAVRYRIAESDKVKAKGCSFQSVDTVSPILQQLLMQLPDKKCDGVTYDFWFVEGLPMTLNSNEATEMGYANGVTGTAVHLELDQREPPHNGAPIWELIYQPLSLQFRPDDPKHPRLPHAPDGVLLIAPKPANFDYEVPKRLRALLRSALGAVTCATLKVQRSANFCVSNGLVISDYSAQGGTMHLGAILDLGKPVFGKLTMLNLYIQLSRVPGPESAALLRLFPVELMMTMRVDPDLEYDMKRLEELANETQWLLERAAASDDTPIASPANPGRVSFPRVVAHATLDASALHQLRTDLHLEPVPTSHFDINASLIHALLLSLTAQGLLRVDFMHSNSINRVRAVCTDTRRHLDSLVPRVAQASTHANPFPNLDHEQCFEAIWRFLLGTIEAQWWTTHMACMDARLVVYTRFNVHMYAQPEPGDPDVTCDNVSVSRSIVPPHGSRDAVIIALWCQIADDEASVHYQATTSTSIIGVSIDDLSVHDDEQDNEERNDGSDVDMSVHVDERDNEARNEDEGDDMKED